MPDATLHIAIIIDEVSRDLGEALEVAAGWGLSRFELREGSEGRFPYWSQGEVRLVEDARRAGARVTAVSPGLFKGAADDEARLSHELEETLPRTIDLAVRLECPIIVAFGFERYAYEPARNRTRAMKAFEQTAEAAAEAGLVVALENEPNFWIDRPEAAVAMLDEIGHPALRFNWDPANLHWGGKVPDRDDFEAIRPRLVNLHAKDYYPARPEAPWLPVGEGDTPWPDVLGWVAEAGVLPHVTLETHCEPLMESARRSLDNVRAMLAGEWTTQDEENEDARR